MKKIFSALLAVMMIVSCFAVTSSAADQIWSMENTEAKSGEEVVITWNFVSPVYEVADTSNPVVLLSYAYDATQLEFVKLESFSPEYEPETVDVADGKIILEAYELPMIADGEAYVMAIALRFKVLAAAGATITLSDDASSGDGTTFMGEKDAYFAADYDCATYSFTVAADEPAVVIGEAASVGAQIRAEKYEDVSDIRFAFTADDTSAVIASVEYKITCNGKEITVDGKTASHDGLFKVVVENVPADYYDANFAVDFVVTYADGTVKTASDINNINAVAA